MLKLAELLESVGKRAAAGYVLAGSEGFLRSEAERAVVAAVFGDRDPGPGYVIVDGAGDAEGPVEPAVVLDEARTVSLFGDDKVVSVRCAGPMVKHNPDRFAPYLAAGCAGSVLLLHVEDWDKRAAYARKLDAHAVDCSSLYESSFGETEISAGAPLGRWIAGRAARRRLRISSQAVVRLIEHVGNNLAELDAALERLDLAASGGGEVGIAAVDAVVAPTRALSQFKVAGMVVAGRTAEALAAASTSFETGLIDERTGRVDNGESSVAVRLMWSIGREIEILYAARGLIDAGGFSRQSAGSIGIPPFKADEVERHARQHTLGGLAEALQVAVKAELDLKTGAVGARFAIERLIMDLGGVLEARPAGVR